MSKRYRGRKRDIETERQEEKKKTERERESLFCLNFEILAEDFIKFEIFLGGYLLYFKGRICKRKVSMIP